jgi:23S rRNA (adenine2503-C2)-methyltransferase
MSLMMDDFGYGISKRRVTLSTSGGAGAGHAGRPDRRCPGHLPARAERQASREIMPINDKYNIEAFPVYVAIWPSPTPTAAGDRGVCAARSHQDDMQHAHELAKVLKETLARST